MKRYEFTLFKDGVPFLAPEIVEATNPNDAFFEWSDYLRHTQDIDVMLEDWTFKAICLDTFTFLEWCDAMENSGYEGLDE
jgi:hypothetical protein